MKPTLALLLASTALTAALGLPALGAIQAPASAKEQPAITDTAPDVMLLLLADNDEDDDDDDEGYDDDDDDDDDDDCDDDDCAGTMSNPAKAGTVAPPDNGLFGNGAPPKVEVN